MVALTEQNRVALAQLCQHYRVERLYVFGSAVSGHFDAARSDLDFLVCFADRQPNSEYAARHLGFAEALEQLFHRPVDLLTEQSIRNPYLRQEIESTRKLVYEQSHPETAV
ncbi:MAG TPA: nucleotidyltransferase domain-containing protein [Sedimentisphaerales bacterium]|nr:nucleotidyltransferase domain-containing protein [Sedimentisphaerales bacterium]